MYARHVDDYPIMRVVDSGNRAISHRVHLWSPEHALAPDSGYLLLLRPNLTYTARTTNNSYRFLVEDAGNDSGVTCHPCCANPHTFVFSLGPHPCHFGVW